MLSGHMHLIPGPGELPIQFRSKAPANTIHRPEKRNRPADKKGRSTWEEEEEGNETKDEDDLSIR